MNLRASVLGRLTPAQFLRRHWQRRPLVVRDAFPGFVAPLGPDELAGLACEGDVESRLVLERGGGHPWQVLHGPFRPARLRRLPRTHWTLLVQGVDRLVPQVAALLEPFRFLPDWRIDDVMVSFAPRFGSVGPHVDSYDVFLLQGLGRRRWDIDPHAAPDFRPGLDLRILERFRPRTSHVLEPGDLLYLPPGVAHHGVSLEPAMTFSIGFRAPSGPELLAAALRGAPRGSREDALYRDPGRRPARSPAELLAADLASLRRLARSETLRLCGPDFDRAIGELLTEPKGPGPDARAPDPKALGERLRSGGASLERRPGARLLFRAAGRETLLFAEGQSMLLSRRLAFVAPLVTGRTSPATTEIARHLPRPGFVAVLAWLVRTGAFAIRPRRRP